MSGQAKEGEGAFFEALAAGRYPHAADEDFLENYGVEQRSDGPYLAPLGTTALFAMMFDRDPMSPSAAAVRRAHDARTAAVREWMEQSGE